MASADGFSTNSIRPRTHAVTSVHLRGRSHSADSSSYLVEHLHLLLFYPMSFLLTPWTWASPCLPAGGTALIFHGFLGPDPWLFYFLHGPFGTCFIKQLSTSHSESWLPIHGWIQLNFDAREVASFKNTCTSLL